MKIIEKSGGELEIASGGGWPSLFGLPFFAMGTLFMLLALSGEMGSRGGGEAPLLIVVPFCSVFIIFGLIFMFGRRGVILNRFDSTATRWIGLLVPMSHRTFSIRSFQEVTLTSELRRTKNSSYVVYPVRLQGAEPLEVGTSRSYEESRMLAERIAEFVSLPLSDSTSGQKITREADELDESLKDSLRRGREENPIPQKPAQMISTVSGGGASLNITIPPSDMGRQVATLTMIAPAVVGLPILGFFAYSGLRLGGLFGFVFGILPVIVVPIVVWKRLLPLLRAAAGESVISIGQGEITVVTTWGKHRSQETVRTSEIEELLIGPTGRALVGGQGGPIMLRSDKATVAFGAQLSEEEKNYLVALIKESIRRG